MDASETAAMTEASGLTNDPHGLENSLREKPWTKKQVDLGRWAEELAERLRKVTVEAPLRSLLVAFVLGVWFARRR
ncbi:hypothetical protein M2175_006977 [Bradyrhizobium elkanii]|uniref:hypothetical protein n=1 Tax=Bradyrhizobium TaxID=374 RepID=UPI001FF7874C|nr:MULTISPECIES: hypothetical protein [Bradyrhizobium]MCK1463497.1 hypothetical protein [Bradyrhizobium sp. 2]MCS3931946.1 hypothetical protein [Bradyrhizobium elkanii]MCS3972504.1 hypothetical protein [Bradyrhizobium japonicum]